jgi:GNAT superfamily N-acetyltransferase
MVPPAPIPRLESLEVDISATSIRAAQRHEPSAAVLDIAGGKAMLLAPNSPMNSVKGVGMAGPVTPADLNAIADFFRSRGSTAPVTFDACPFADDSLAALIAARAWPFAGFEQVLWRPLIPSSSSPQLPPSPTITTIDQSRAEEWSLLLARVFSGQENPPQWQIDIGLRSFDAEGGTAWAALHNNHMIAAARSFIHNKAAHLSGAAVLPAYRNQGLQSALFQARLHHATAQGCDLAKTDTKPGTTSQRNAHRQGFHVAYTRAQFMMPL